MVRCGLFPGYCYWATLSHVSHVKIPRPDTPDNLSSRSPAVPSTPLPHLTGHHYAVVCAVGRSTCWASPITRGLWQYVGEGLDERSRVDCFGFISSLLMAGRRRLVTRRSSHATLDGALLAPSLHTMANNTSHGPRNRFGWPRGPKFLSIASGGRVVLLCLRAMCNDRCETLWWRHTPICAHSRIGLRSPPPLPPPACL